jgi:hypothetical protein
MKTAMTMWSAGRRQIILEALEERIVLDGAVDHTLVDIAAHAADAAGADATGGGAAHAVDAAGVDPAGYWAWEHNAWCYHDTGFEWWWWPDSSSPQGGNWLYHGAGWTGMWNYDWNDGGEWFVDAFYNNRYFHEGDLYWGQDGSHNWYYSSTFSTDFSSWHGLGSLVEGVVYADFESEHGNIAQCRTPSGSWVYSGSLVFLDTEYSSTGWHSVSQFDPDLYDGVGWSHEPTILSWRYESSSNNYYCTIYGTWTGGALMHYYIENPSGPTQGQDMDVAFLFNDDPDFDYLKNYTGQNWRVVYYDSNNFNMDSWIYQAQMISYAEGSPIDDLAIMQHGAQNNFWVGTQCIMSYNFSSYSSYFAELGEALGPPSSIESWHCSVAGNSEGETLCGLIAETTGVTVWASDGPTCIVPNGDVCTDWHGDRSLEYGIDALGNVFGPSWAYSWFESPWNEALLDPGWLERS